MPLHLPSRGAPSGVRRSTRVRRRAAAVLTVCAVAVTVSANAPTAATADPTTPGSATSKAAQADIGAGLALAPNSVTLLPDPNIQAALTLLGLGGVTSLTNSLTSGIVTPLVNALTALPSSILNSLVTSITNAGLRADSPTSQQPRPTDGSYPTCGQQGWTSGSGGDCYSGLPALGTPGLLSVSTGLAQGYATGTTRVTSRPPTSRIRSSTSSASGWATSAWWIRPRRAR